MRVGHWIEHGLPRQTVLLCLVAALFVAGCGDGDSGDAQESNAASGSADTSDGAASPEQAVREAYTAFLGHLRAKDYSATCELMTAKAQQSFRPADCEQGFEALLSKAKTPPTKPRVTAVKIKGAKAQVTVKMADFPPGTARMVKQGDEWKVSDSIAR